MAHSKKYDSFNLNIQNFEGDPDLLEFFWDQIKELSELNAWDSKRQIAFLQTKLCSS